MLDWRGEDCIGDTGKCAGGVVFPIGETAHAGDKLARLGFGAPLFKKAPGGVEGAKLDGYAGAYSEERCEGAFVEG